jgi:hypothetical protein
MEWVSFDDIKKAVTLQMVLDRYGVGLKRIAPGSLRGKCPLPTHSSKESKESFTATFNKGTGGAWACQSQSCVAARGGRRGGNALDFVAVMEGCSVREAALKLQQWFSVPASDPKPAPAEQEPRTEAGQEPKKQLVSKESGNQQRASDVDHRAPRKVIAVLASEWTARFQLHHIAWVGVVNLHKTSISPARRAARMLGGTPRARSTCRRRRPDVPGRVNTPAIPLSGLLQRGNQRFIDGDNRLQRRKL